LDLRILLMDDDPLVFDALGHDILGLGLSKTKRREQPWTIQLGSEEVNVYCEPISDPTAAEQIFQAQPSGAPFKDIDIILLDNDWETAGRKDRFGLDLLKKSGWKRNRGPFVAVYTAAATFEPAFVYEALSVGADALIRKQEKIHLLNVLVAASEHKRARLEMESVRKQSGLLVEVDPGLASRSSAMKRTLEKAALLAPWSKEPVLIVGDIGTGKTRLAKAIHKCSPRASGPFVTLEPGDLSENLLQSELFGVERGAFTGAVARKGLLEEADGGTLFIDELQNMPIEMQVALRNTIEGRPYRRVGDTKEKKANIRFIFASNAHLDLLVQQGALKEDFYSRIQMHMLQMPSLQDRLEDIPQLAVEFASEFYTENLPGRTPPDFSDEALLRLKHADWPYNIRSLRNVIRRTLAHSPGAEHIRASDLIFEGSQEPQPFTQDDVSVVLELAPKAGSQRLVFERLLERLPAVVSYEELHDLIGTSAGSDAAAAGNLMTIMSRLRTRLQSRGFDIRQDSEKKGYVLVKVA
jgi:DNA-binding NtrC family response regulator